MSFLREGHFLLLSELECLFHHQKRAYIFSSQSFSHSAPLSISCDTKRLSPLVNILLILVITNESAAWFHLKKTRPVQLGFMAVVKKFYSRHKISRK